MYDEHIFYFWINVFILGGGAYSKKIGWYNFPDIIMKKKLIKRNVSILIKSSFMKKKYWIVEKLVCILISMF